MSLTTYCDFAEIRSALGVNHIELKDEVLGLPVYEMGLVRELNKISTSLNAAFSSIYVKSASLRTVPEAALHDAVRLFSVYAAAKQVGVSLAVFAPKEVGDGKATTSRFAGEPFENVLTRVDSMYSELRSDVRSAYDELMGSGGGSSSATPATAFMASTRRYDPVTG